MTRHHPHDRRDRPPFGVEAVANVKAMLEEYVAAAAKAADSAHTPHDLAKALSWHARFVETGTMKV